MLVCVRVCESVHACACACVCVQPFRFAQWRSMAIGQVRCCVSTHVVSEMSLPVDGGDPAGEVGQPSRGR